MPDFNLFKLVSDEEWNGDPAESSVYLLQPQHVSLSRPQKDKASESQRYLKSAEPQSPPSSKYKDEKYLPNQYRKEDAGRNSERPFGKYPEKEFLDHPRNFEREKTLKTNKERSSKTVDRNIKYFGNNSENYVDSKEDFSRYPKMDRFADYSNQRGVENFAEKKGLREKYFESDGFDEPRR